MSFFPYPKSDLFKEDRPRTSTLEKEAITLTGPLPCWKATLVILSGSIGGILSSGTPVVNLGRKSIRICLKHLFSDSSSPCGHFLIELPSVDAVDPSILRDSAATSEDDDDVDEPVANKQEIGS